MLFYLRLPRRSQTGVEFFRFWEQLGMFSHCGWARCLVIETIESFTNNIMLPQGYYLAKYSYGGSVCHEQPVHTHGAWKHLLMGLRHWECSSKAGNTTKVDSSPLKGPWCHRARKTPRTEEDMMEWCTHSSPEPLRTRLGKLELIWRHEVQPWEKVTCRPTLDLH